MENELAGLMLRVKSQGVTAEALARASGVALRTVQRAISGEVKSPHRGTVEKLESGMQRIATEKDKGFDLVSFRDWYADLEPERKGLILMDLFLYTEDHVRAKVLEAVRIIESLSIPERAERARA